MYIENNSRQNKTIRKILGFHDKIINSAISDQSKNHSPPQRNLSARHKNRLVINNFNKNNIQMIPKTQRRKLTVINDFFSSSLKSNEWSGKLIFSKTNNINYQSPPKTTIDSYKNFSTSSSNFISNNYHINKIAYSSFHLKDFYNTVKDRGPLLSNRDAYNELNKKINKILKEENLKIEPTKKKKHFGSDSLISKRIKILKNVKNIFSKYQNSQKISNSSILSLLSMNDEKENKEHEGYFTRNRNKKNGFSYEKKYFFTNSDKLFNNKPVLIKHMPKPKFKLAKYSTLNHIKIT